MYCIIRGCGATLLKYWDSVHFSTTHLHCLSPGRLKINSTLKPLYFEKNVMNSSYLTLIVHFWYLCYTTSPSNSSLKTFKFCPPISCNPTDLWCQNCIQAPVTPKTRILGGNVGFANVISSQKPIGSWLILYRRRGHPYNPKDEEKQFLAMALAGTFVTGGFDKLVTFAWY